jgi:hypothetical protein
MLAIRQPVYSKRYTIFNKHVGGRNRMPQGFHALNRLWATKDQMSETAQKLLMQWGTESEVEIVLEGGTDPELEALYFALSNITDIPSAKFNEPDMRGSCMVVTFVATDRIVAGGSELRGRRIAPYDAETFLKANTVGMPDGSRVQLSDDEIFVVVNSAFLRLAE